MKYTLTILAMTAFMSAVCTGQTYIDMELEPEKVQLGVGGSILFLPDDILDESPYTGAQMSLDLPMGRNFVLGIKGDVYQKNVEVEELRSPEKSYLQQRRLYSLGGQLSLDPGDTGKGVYVGAQMNYLWGDFQREDPETQSGMIQDDNHSFENQWMTGVHAGVTADISERIGVGVQTDFNFSFNELELPSALTKVQAGVKFRF
ncbi:MAG: hypothetical protein HKN79_06460 [Flavobacteriales bacterium]|nr:hypothetical protein [Flavobacteriales bacterium]